MYDYIKALEHDIWEYIAENGRPYGRDAADELEDILWVEDSVTGNGSGSYTMSACEAIEHIYDNVDLAIEAIEAFGSPDDYERVLTDPEGIDVLIRCYLLRPAIDEVLERIREEELEAADDWEDDDAEEEGCGPSPAGA